MTLNTIDELEVISALTRARIIEYSHRTNTPHLGSCLSCVDILVALYFGILNIDPKDHRNPERGARCACIVPGAGAKRLLLIPGHS